MLWRRRTRVSEMDHERVGRWTSFRVRVLAMEMLFDDLVERDKSGCSEGVSSLCKGGVETTHSTG